MNKCKCCGELGSYVGRLLNENIFICDACLPGFYKNLEEYLEKREQIEQKEEKKESKFTVEIEEFYKDGEKID
jgi:hypothetical protein